MDFIITHSDSLVVFLVIIGMFILFFKNAFPIEVVALGGISILLVLQILSFEQALTVFSNPAPWTIGTMFILSGALVRTGVLSDVYEFISKQSQSSPILTIGLMIIFVVFSSAFMNNTPVVLALIPLVVQLSKELNTTSSKLLIPLSFISIFGGMCTLIGTSTNLLVDGVARAKGLEPFTLFEVTPLAVILATFGIIYLIIFAPRLLPDRESMAEFLRDRSKMNFFVDVVIPEGSPLVGRRPKDVSLFSHREVRVIDIYRDNESCFAAVMNGALKTGDRLVLRTVATEMEVIFERYGLSKTSEEADKSDVQDDDIHASINKVSAKKTKALEVLISPGCTIIGKKLKNLDLGRKYNIYPYALHRPTEKSIPQFTEVALRVGDTLLVEGSIQDMGRFAEDFKLVEVAEPSSLPYRRGKAPIVIASFLGIILGAAFGLAPIALLGILAVTVVLFTRCIDAEEAFDFADARLLVLIWSMLAIGKALNVSGGMTLMGDFFSYWLVGLPPFIVIWVIYVLTSVMTELFSNSAVAIILTPVAIGVGWSLGVDPRGLVVAVMIAASASFVTPIGYQTNTLVYGPGGYEFKDFFKIGLPLTICTGILASLIIPFFWPLT